MKQSLGVIFVGVAGVAAVSSGGCDRDVSESSAPGDLVVTADTRLQTDADSGPHPSSGWLDFEDSAVKPWCGAVLVAPDVMVTATHCVEGVPAFGLRAGFGPIVRDGIAVQSIQSLQAAPELSAIVLEHDAAFVDPAMLGAAIRDGVHVDSISYRFVPRNDATTDRWTWSGVLDQGLVVVRDGEPNCHSDPGAGAYTEDGALIGIVVGGKTGEGTCVDRIRLSHPTGDGDAFEEALSLSTGPS